MLARIFFIVLGIGVGGSVAQGPEFVQQYMQRLGGHIDELSAYITRLDEDANQSGISRQKALDEFTRYNSLFLQSRGRDAQFMVARHDRLTLQQSTLVEAGPFERLAVFAQNYDTEIAAATMSTYRPAIPATAEGFLLGAVGFFFGYVVGEILLRFGRWGMRRTFVRAQA